MSSQCCYRNEYAMQKVRKAVFPVGGLGTRGMLVSYRGLRDEEKRLAAALRIELATGGELARLKERIRSWVGR